jgi:glycosyltransferase involved in cell wall biosynthesis
MRVLHVHAGNIYGGVEAMMLTQVRQRNLCPAMETSFVLCFAGRFSEELNAAGASVHQLGGVRIRQPLSVRRARRSLTELLRRKSFDVIVTHSCWSQAVFGPTVRAASVPLAFYLHAPPTGRQWLERMARRTAPDLALCNSKFTAAALPQLYPGVRSEIVYCPVAPPGNGHSEADTKLIRAELKTPEDATVIIQVSRMEAWKGHAQHLEALSLLTDLPDWVCWQVGGAQTSGEKKYLDQLKVLANRLGIAERVRFLNQRSDVTKLLAASDIFCQPNCGPESFGIAFIEALYARLPVVTTDMGAAREIVDDSCAVVVTPGDAHLLAMGLRRLIEEPALRIELGSAGPDRAGALCDPAVQLNQFHTALEDRTRIRLDS